MDFFFLRIQQDPQVHWHALLFGNQSLRGVSCNKLFQNFRNIKRSDLFLLKTSTVAYSDVPFVWGIR